MAWRVLSRIPKANAQLLSVRASLPPKLRCGFFDFSRPASSFSKGTPSESVEANGDITAFEQSNCAEPVLPVDTIPVLHVEEFVKLAAERDHLLKLKQKEIEMRDHLLKLKQKKIEMQEKVIRTNEEMENILERTKREIENSKKYGIQDFAKCSLDFADNLGRVLSAVKGNLSKIDQTSDNVTVTVLKSYLEDVEIAEKDLSEVFRKFGIQKYDPLNENFDPNRHNAVFEIPDASKPPGVIAVVLKPGYMIYDRVLRPAEVGVTKSHTDEN